MMYGGGPMALVFEHQETCNIFRVSIPDKVKDRYLPAQYRGGSTEIAYSKMANTLPEAGKNFELACARLTDIDTWANSCAYLKLDFALINNERKNVKGHARENHFIRVLLPGITNSEDGIYSWSAIDALKYEHIFNDRHILIMETRPSHVPGSASKAIAHYFKAKTTISFIILQDGLSVTAAAVSRNEQPNTLHHLHIENEVEINTYRETTRQVLKSYLKKLVYWFVSD